MPPYLSIPPGRDVSAGMHPLLPKKSSKAMAAAASEKAPGPIQASQPASLPSE